ncbi:MAG: hypothetical protein QOH88_1892 [Verrucomicrobiota bacterium]
MEELGCGLRRQQVGISAINQVSVIDLESRHELSRFAFAFLDGLATIQNDFQFHERPQAGYLIKVNAGRTDEIEQSGFPNFRPGA